MLLLVLCFPVIPGPHLESLQSLLIEGVPVSGPGNSNNNSRPLLAGRGPLTARAGAGGGRRWEVSQKEGSLRSYILGRLHVLPRQPLKWLHLISMVLITSDRKPSIQGSSIKQTNPIWACKIDWAPHNAVKGWGLYISSFFFFFQWTPRCHNYCRLSWIKTNQ